VNDHDVGAFAVAPKSDKSGGYQASRRMGQLVLWLSGACLNGDNSNGSLAFDLKVAKRLALEAILDLTPTFIGHRDAPWHRLAGHAGGNIYGVAPMLGVEGW
jgi:hypothetical protein